MIAPLVSLHQKGQLLPSCCVRHVLVLLVAGLFVVLPTFGLAQSVQLNSVIGVEADYVTLGDIFTSVTHGADHVIAPAPKLGKVLVFNSKTLRRIARSFKLDWEPRASFIEATVRRVTTGVAVELVEEAVLNALMDRAHIKPRSEQRWVVQIENLPQQYFAPANVVLNVQVANLYYDPLVDRFQADVVLHDGGNNVRVRGEFLAMIAVPVPLHSIAPEEKISQHDLHFVDMRKDRVSPNVQTDVAKIVGKSPKRLLRADAPIAMQYLQEPLLVKRRNLVLVVYAMKNLTLVTKGMAMSGGSMGQVVQVKNLKSNRIINSVVTGSDEVSVSFASQLAQGN